MLRRHRRNDRTPSAARGPGGARPAAASRCRGKPAAQPMAGSVPARGPRRAAVGSSRRSGEGGVGEECCRVTPVASAASNQSARDRETSSAHPASELRGARLSGWAVTMKGALPAPCSTLPLPVTYRPSRRSMESHRSSASASNQLSQPCPDLRWLERLDLPEQHAAALLKLRPAESVDGVPLWSRSDLVEIAPGEPAGPFLESEGLTFQPSEDRPHAPPEGRSTRVVAVRCWLREKGERTIVVDLQGAAGEVLRMRAISDFRGKPAGIFGRQVSVHRAPHDHQTAAVVLVGVSGRRRDFTHLLSGAGAASRLAGHRKDGVSQVFGDGRDASSGVHLIDHLRRLSASDDEPAVCIVPGGRVGPPCFSMAMAPDGPSGSAKVAWRTLISTPRQCQRKISRARRRTATAPMRPRNRISGASFLAARSARTEA